MPGSEYIYDKKGIYRGTITTIDDYFVITYEDCDTEDLNLSELRHSLRRSYLLQPYQH